MAIRRDPGIHDRHPFTKWNLSLIGNMRLALLKRQSKAIVINLDAVVFDVVCDKKRPLKHAAFFFETLWEKGALVFLRQPNVDGSRLPHDKTIVVNSRYAP